MNIEKYKSDPESHDPLSRKIIDSETTRLCKDALGNTKYMPAVNTVRRILVVWDQVMHKEPIKELCKWVEITEKTELPTKEVIACNMKPKTYGFKEVLVGRISQCEDEGYLYCSNENEILENVTHYMEIKFPEPIKIKGE